MLEMDKSSEKLEELKILYREKRFWEFKRKFWVNAIYLETEDRERVHAALKKLTPEQTKTPEIIEYALKELGGKIIN